MSSKVGFADSLGKNVVSAGICAGCGACVAVCPNGCLRWEKGRPDLQRARAGNVSAESIQKYIEAQSKL
jgi:ferredoxin